MTKIDQCPFCDLENLRIIEQNENAVIFFSNPRLTAGHLLVVPKRHVERPWELTETERSDIFDLLFKYQRLITEKLATGCDIKEHYRPFLVQGRLKVDHIHFHLVPRELFDDIWQKVQTESDLFSDLEKSEMNFVQNKLELK